MSLLLDALKRAEQEKQSRQNPGPAKPTLELAPVAASAPPAARTAGAAGAATGAAAPAPTPLSAKSLPSSRPRWGLWIGAGAVVLAIVAGAGYLWYSLSSLTPPPARAAPLRPIPPVATTAPIAAPAPSAPAVRTETPAAAAEPPRARAPAESRPAPAVAAPRAEPAGLLQPARPAERARVAPEVAAGYDALRRGDLPAAKREYSAALAADGTNLDAMLGLATAEARSGRNDVAAALYRMALQIDPRNATALAGMAALSELSRPDALEQRLLQEIAQHPSSASLHFMLGNVYAGQSLWTQAQAAYYEAHRLEPGNPDILHNLAVSLDRLGQTRVAATMYRRALEAARTQATQFDAAGVERRLAEITDDAPTSRGPQAPR